MEENIFEYLIEECGDQNEVAWDNNDVKDNDDDYDDADSKDVEVVEISTGEILAMLDRLVNLKYLPRGEMDALVAIKLKLEKIRVLDKKQSHISDYFVSE